MFTDGFVCSDTKRQNRQDVRFFNKEEISDIYKASFQLFMLLLLKALKYIPPNVKHFGRINRIIFKDCSQKCTLTCILYIAAWCRVTPDPPVVVLKWYLPLSYVWAYLCIPPSILITIDGLGYRMLGSPSFLYISKEGGLIFSLLIFTFHLSKYPECSDWLPLFALGLQCHCLVSGVICPCMFC